MPLIAYNKTRTSIALTAGNPIVTLRPPFPVGEKTGPAYNVTAQLKGLSAENYASLQTLVASGVVEFVWTSFPEYSTESLSVISLLRPAPVVTDTTEDVLAKTAVFDNLQSEETGSERAITLFSAAPYKLRILQVFGTVSRGAPNAQMYLCCHPGGGHIPHSDKFDASQPGQVVETCTVQDRVIEEGEEVFAFCSTDYVLGTLTMVYQRLNT